MAGASVLIGSDVVKCESVCRTCDDTMWVWSVEQGEAVEREVEV